MFDDDENDSPVRRIVISIPEKNTSESHDDIDLVDLEKIAINRVKKLSRESFFQKLKTFFSLIELSKDIKEKNDKNLYS